MDIVIVILEIFEVMVKLIVVYGKGVFNWNFFGRFFYMRLSDCDIGFVALGMFF